MSVRFLWIVIFQTLFLNPTPANPFNPNADQRKLASIPLTGPTLLTGRQIPLIVGTPTILFAVPHDMIGQQAVDDCNAGKLPPILGPLGTGTPSCENQRQPAIQADIVRRVNLAVNTLTPSVLTTNDLYLSSP